MSDPTSPGWYDDPQDPAQLRYFDGIVWTAHTTARVSPTASDSTIGHAAAMPSAAERRHQPAADPWAAQRRQGPGGAYGSPPAYGASTERRMPDGDVLAEWWRRLLGRIIDIIITSILTNLASLPFQGPFLEQFRTYLQAAANGEQPSLTPMLDAVAEVALPVGIVGLLVAAVYEVLFLMWKSATPGKMIVGTVVRPAAAPGRITVLVAIRRQLLPALADGIELVPLVGVLGLFLGLIDPAWLLWDPRRQALHDKVADTVVVLRRR